MDLITMMVLSAIGVVLAATYSSLMCLDCSRWLHARHWRTKVFDNNNNNSKELENSVRVGEDTKLVNGQVEKEASTREDTKLCMNLMKMMGNLNEAQMTSSVTSLEGASEHASVGASVESLDAMIERCSLPQASWHYITPLVASTEICRSSPNLRADSELSPYHLTWITPLSIAPRSFLSDPALGSPRTLIKDLLVKAPETMAHTWSAQAQVGLQSDGCKVQPDKSSLLSTSQYEEDIWL